MKHFVYTIALFASNLFFSISAILGLSVVNSDGANGLYKAFCLVVFCLFLYYYLKEYAGKKISSKHFLSTLILFIYIFSGLFSGYANNTTFLVLVAFCLPAAGIAVYYSEHNDISKLIKWIDVLLPIMSFSLLFSLKQLLVEIAEGESYYSQTLSYYAAYYFILYLFFILFGNDYERFGIFKKKGYKYISYLMLPYLLSIMFFSGGRGALGTLAVGVFVILYRYNRSYGFNKLKILRYFLIAGVLASIVYVNIPEDLRLILENNYQRVFSFFDTDKDMMERTSGRDEVLKVAFDQIHESPLIGHGLFSYKDTFVPIVENPYPHNLFVEILLQGGYLFLFFFILILIYLLVKLHHILKIPSHEIVAIFTIFSLTLLMYSGSYMQNSFFWFFVMYVFNYQFNKQYRNL